MTTKAVNPVPAPGSEPVSPTSTVVIGLRSDSSSIDQDSLSIRMGSSGVLSSGSIPEDDDNLIRICESIKLESVEKRVPELGEVSRSIVSGSLVIQRTSSSPSERSVYSIRSKVLDEASLLAYVKIKTDLSWAGQSPDWLNYSEVVCPYIGLEIGQSNTACYLFLRRNGPSSEIVVGGPLPYLGGTRPATVALPNTDWASYPSGSSVEAWILLDRYGYPPPYSPANYPIVEVWVRLPSEEYPVLKASIPLSDLGNFDLSPSPFFNSRVGPDDFATLYVGNAGLSGESLEVEKWSLFPDYRLAMRGGIQFPSSTVDIVPNIGTLYDASSGKLPTEFIPTRWSEVPGWSAVDESLSRPGWSGVPTQVVLNKSVDLPSGLERMDPGLESSSSGCVIELAMSAQESVEPDGDVFGAGFGIDDGVKVYQVVTATNPYRTLGLSKSFSDPGLASSSHLSTEAIDWRDRRTVRLTLDKQRQRVSVESDYSRIIDLPLSSEFPDSSSGTGRVFFGHLLNVKERGAFRVSSIRSYGDYRAWEAEDGVNGFPTDGPVPFSLIGSGNGDTVPRNTSGEVAIEKYDVDTPGSCRYYFVSDSLIPTDGLYLDFSCRVSSFKGIDGSLFTPYSWSGVGVKVSLGMFSFTLGFFECGAYGKKVGIIPGAGNVEDILRQTQLGISSSASVDWTSQTRYRLEYIPGRHINLYVGKYVLPAISIPWDIGNGGFTLTPDTSSPGISFGHLSGDTSSNSLWKFFRTSRGTGRDISITQSFPDGLQPFHFGGEVSSVVTAKDLSSPKVTIYSQGNVLQERRAPTALFTVDPQFAVIGSVVRLDGSPSTDPLELPLVYTWSFARVPIGSKVEAEGFRVLDSSGATVTFSPDIVGEYLITLKVSNGVYESETYPTQVSVRSMLVPHGRGLVPDGKFIWSYIRDVWSQVEDREWFETLWSALIQIVGADLLKLYQNDFNKSIRDIQDLYQRRWLSYEPKLNITTQDCTFYLGNHCAGRSGTTTDIGVVGQSVIINKSNLLGSPGELIVVSGSVLPDCSGKTIDITYDSRQPDNVHAYEIIGANASKSGYLVRRIVNPYGTTPPHPEFVPDRDQGLIVPDCFPTFDFQSTVWSFGPGIRDYALWQSESPQPIDYLPPMFPIGGSGIDSVLVGDIIQVKSGINSGFYRIIDKSSTTVTVDRNPPSSGNGLVACDIYRPVGFRVSVQPQEVTDTFAIPYEPSTINPSDIALGRLVVFNGSAYKVTRKITDPSRLVPLVLLTDENGEVLTGLSGASWRIPHTIVSKSQNFEELGVSSGDRIVVDVLDTSTGAVCPVICQVIGVLGNRIGVILTDEFPAQGEVPEIPFTTYSALSSTLGIDSVFKDPAGNTVLSGEAKSLVDYINSGRFRSSYWNVQLNEFNDINVLGRTFRIQPRFIIRNRFIPVPETLASVPSLQDWIVQPSTITRDGNVYQVKDGKEYEIPSLPVSLIENTDYTIDGEVAFYGDLDFNSGSDIIESNVGHFIDRNLRPNDIFTVMSPDSISGDYRIRSVLSNSKILLQTPVPRYVLSELVTARVRITRRSKGRFIRMLPGGFTAKNPAPNRLWSEVSLFDNNESIENNFGLLVGLTREDVNSITEPVNYRQAVTGLMYAFAEGTSVGRARLGAQILLGLPFSEHRGIIRSIEKNYRLDGFGNPIMGRLLVEDLDANDVPQALYRIYTYPIDSGATLSGIEVNPDTGLEYVVGDIIPPFRPLCKGVEVLDYLSRDYSRMRGEALIQRYNSMYVRANHNIFSEQEMALLSSFLKKITPAYLAFIVSTVAEVRDSVLVRDREDRVEILHAEDNVSFGPVPAVMFDGKSGWAPYAYWDDGFYWVRKCGRGLTSTYGSGTPSFTLSGVTEVITPPFGEGPITKSGDYLAILDGPNQGTYPISSVTDTSITISGAPLSGLQTASQGYMVLRKVSSKILSGTGSYSSSSDVVTLDQGLTAAGVIPGDILLIQDPTSSTYYRRTILRVGGTTSPDGYSPPLSSGEAQISSVLPSSSSSKEFHVFRPQINIPEEEGIMFTVTPDSPDSPLVSISDPLIVSLLDSGDDLVDISSGRRYTVLDPFLDKPWVTPPVGSSFTGRMEKRRPSRSSIPYDQLNYSPVEEAKIIIKEDNPSAATCGTYLVTLRSWDGVSYTTLDTSTIARPGDYLRLLNGGNSLTDVGAGPGVYPIVEVEAFPGTVKIWHPLGSSDPSAWEVIRRR